MTLIASKNLLYKKLGLTDFEFEQIVKRLKRVPNELETYIFSAMWSEHCGYKHSKKYISEFPQKGSVLSKENAGGIEVGNHIIFFKAESHNHPSAVEPYQGAATGIGGIIRDVLALGARPIALLDSLKFGNLKSKRTRYLLNGVVKGISTYGNSTGIPTVAGEVSFDECYTNSPLVNVMAVGIADKKNIKLSKAVPDKTVVVIGSHTGRDGIHGASFASKELNDNLKEDRISVQIADPFMKKNLIEAVLEIIKLEGVIACQDCGAAGLLSSTCEMAYKGGCGMELYLDCLHCREENMLPWEMMLSESQERMIFIADNDCVQKIIEISEKFLVPYSVIGKTIEKKEYNLYFHNKLEASLPPEILNEPYLYNLDDKKPEYIDKYKSLNLSEKADINYAVKKMISNVNISSKKMIYSQYDYKVGNRTMVHPGDSGAARLWIYEEDKILGLTIDSLPRQVFLNPYQGTINTFLEAYRNLVSSGFKPAGLTNCLNFANPENYETAYQFVQSVKGLKEASGKLDVPVVSGNVSFYNECSEYKVYPTPVIGMVGMTDVSDNLITNKAYDNETIFLIGRQINDKSCAGGSLYQKVLHNFLGGDVSICNLEEEKKLADLILFLNKNKYITACNDVSEGGIFCALFELLIQNKIGFYGSLINISDKEKALFGEIGGQYLVSSSTKDTLKKYLDENKISYSILGICGGDKIKFDGYEFDLFELIESYENSLFWETNNET